jgi:tetratricopeptide (TPR) repeat protein
MSTRQTKPLFENKGLTELKIAWKKNHHLETQTLVNLAKENYEAGNHAVSLFLADQILKEKNPDASTEIELRFIRAEGYFAFKFYRQAYPDYLYYVKNSGKNGQDLSQKISQCRRMIHTGNIGSILFIAVSVLSLDVMYWALYQLQDDFPMGISIEWVYYTGIFGMILLIFGLFYRYAVIPKIK